jgi:hypothetical protein
MNRQGTVQIVCGDSHLACRYLAALDRGGQPRACAVVSTPAEARKIYQLAEPLVTLLDESAITPQDSLESVVAMLAGSAPVVVVAAPERQSELAFLITSGAADFVSRSGSFILLAADRIERRVLLATLAADLPVFSGEEFAGDFGEILRHELNNQLTGVLGNAELLLAHRDRLPADAVERVQTIGQLAVRLRETVRRLSHAWDIWQRQPRSPSGTTLAQPLLQPQPPPPGVTTLSRNSDARQSATRLASFPKTPSPQLGQTPRSPETLRDAAVARWDRRWQSRKG